MQGHRQDGLHLRHMLPAHAREPRAEYRRQLGLVAVFERQYLRARTAVIAEDGARLAVAGRPLHAVPAERHAAHRMLERQAAMVADRVGDEMNVPPAGGAVCRKKRLQRHPQQGFGFCSVVA